MFPLGPSGSLWWWDSERFPIFKEINVYYKIIEKLNQKLNNPKNTKYTIIGLIVEGDDAIKIRCSDLLRGIDSLIDGT